MTKTISIYEQEFEVAEPYAEGHKLSDREAAALNQMRAENVANNMRKHVKAAVDEGTDEAMKAVRQAFVDYDQSYDMSTAPVRASRATITPLEKEARKVARTWLVAELKKAGKTLKAYTDENGKDYVASKIEEIAAVESIQKVAKKNLADAAKMAEAGLGIAV